MKKTYENSDAVPEPGDIVEVTYLTGAPMRGIIIKERMVSSGFAETLKKYYPDIKEGDKYYAVAEMDDPAGIDTRDFFPSAMKLITRRDDNPAEKTARENIAGLTDARLEILRKKRPAKPVFKQKPPQS